MRRFLHEFPEDLLFDFHFLGGRFDHDLDIPHFNRRARRDDAGTSFLRFLIRHDSAFDGVGVNLLDAGQSARQLLRSHIAQNHRHSA